MINNLLLLASAIYIYVDAMRTLKGFILSKILHLCFYGLGHQFYMLDLLQLQEPGLNYICYRSSADIRFSWPVKTSRWSKWVQKVDLQVLLTLSISLTTPIYHFLSYLHATYSVVLGLCGHPTKTCLSGNVK